MTLKALYQTVTGDTRSHQRAIDGRFRKLDARRQRIIRARLEGRSLREIGDCEGITHGSAQSVIEVALRKIRKELAGEPRYRPGSRTKKRADGSAAAPEVAMSGRRTTPR